MKDKKYISITEVSELLKINKHVIRYWDAKFDGISTRLTNKKQRYFSHENIQKIQQIKNLLYPNGKHAYSLDLAEKFLNNNNLTFPKNVKKPSLNSKFAHPLNIQSLKIIRNNLKKLLDY